MIPFAAVKATQVSGGSEPVILTDRSGQFVWIGDTSGGYWSDDNGTKWTRMGAYAGGFDLLFVDGWDLAQDDAGNLYAAVLRANRVDIVRSADGGKSWNQVGYAGGVSGTADRPWIAAKGDGELALFYFDAPTVLFGFAEHCARSEDGGRTFLDRDPVSVLPGHGGSAFYDTQGRLHFSSNNGNLYRYDSTCVAGGTAIPMAGAVNHNNMLQGTADGTDLYMVAGTDGSAAMTLYGSQDGGPPRKLVVSPPDVRSNTYGAVSAHNGQVAVAWYGSTTAGDPSAEGFQGEFHTYLAIVDGFWGASPRITHHRLTETPNHKGQICMGGVGCNLEGNNQRELLDYFKLDHDIWGGIHVAYVDDTAGPKVLHVHLPPARPPPPPASEAPVASFRVQLEGRTVAVDATASRSPVGSPLSFEWDWGDGARGTGQTAEHEYAEFGAYDIRLVATDATGRAGAHVLRVRVDGMAIGPPEASWTHRPTHPVAGETVTFQDTSRAMPGANLADFSWDLGDGTEGRGATIEHTFAAAGTYMVRLTVRDDRGAENSATQEILVNQVAEPTEAPTSEPASLPLWLLLAGIVGSTWTRRHRRH